MKLALRVLLLIVIIPPMAFFLALISSMPLTLIGIHQTTFTYLIVLLLGVIATITVAIFVLKARVDVAAVGLYTAVRVGAIVVGNIGFVGGIVWMEVYYPEGDTNFIIGPIVGSLAFVLGALGNLFCWIILRIVKSSETNVKVTEIFIVD